MAKDEGETEGSLERRLHRHSYDRLMILSDGVFAIAITLAAFEIKAPDSWHDLTDLWMRLRLPLGTYFVSFAFVASYWHGQRTLFARLVRVDAPLTVLALLQLLFVALIPVATGLFYDHIEQAGARSVYLATLATCGYLTAAIWGYAALNPALMHIENRPVECWAKFSKALIGPLMLTWVMVTNGSTSIAIVGAVVVLLAHRLIFRRLNGRKA